jgi:phage baseplate assembly protein W
LWQFIDYPLQTAIPLIVREVTEAITLWEPRVQLVKVIATPVIDGSQQSGAQMAVTVKWRLKLGNRSQSAAPFAAAVQDTTVAIGSALVINSGA